MEREPNQGPDPAQQRNVIHASSRIRWGARCCGVRRAVDLEAAFDAARDAPPRNTELQRSRFVSRCSLQAKMTTATMTTAATTIAGVSMTFEIMWNSTCVCTHLDR
jgi:hypothetical protein